MLIETISVLSNEGFYDSALLLAEYTYSSLSYNPNEIAKKSTDSELFYLVFLIAKILKAKKYYARIYSFLSSRQEFLKYTQIRNIFYDAVHKIEKQLTNFDSLNNETVQIKEKHYSPLNVNSLNKYYSTFLNVQTNDINEINESFKLDERNFEVLFKLYYDFLISKEDFDALIDSCSITEIQKAAKTLFSNYKTKTHHFYYKSVSKFVDQHLLSPYSALKVHKYYEINKMILESTSLCSFILENFPNDHLTYIITCSFYLERNLLKSAHKSINEAIFLCNNSCFAQLYTGYVFSKLNDPVSALQCFKKAKTKMPMSYKPLLHIAIELQRFHDVLNARMYFHLAYEKEKNFMVYVYYLRFLFEIQEFKLFEKILQSFNKDSLNESNFEITEFYSISCLLFQIAENKEFDSDTLIKGIKSEWKGLACKGFVAYLNNKWHVASEHFFDADLKKLKNIVIKELLHLSLNKLKIADRSEKIDMLTELYLELTNDYDISTTLLD